MTPSGYWRQHGETVFCFEDEPSPDVMPFLSLEDGYTRTIADIRYKVKEIKYGTFSILRDILKDHSGIAGRAKGKEGPGCQPTAFDCNVSGYYDHPDTEDDEVRL